MPDLRGPKLTDSLDIEVTRFFVFFKEQGSDVTVVAFLIFPAATNNFNVDSFRAQAIVKQLRETVNDIQKDMGTRLFEVCLRGRIPTGNDVLKQVRSMKRFCFLYLTAHGHTRWNQYLRKSRFLDLTNVSVRAES